MLFRYVMLAENDVRVSRNGQKEKEMKIVVIGDGKIGFTVTQALVKEGHDLVVIDNQSAALKQTEDSLDVQVLEGNGASVSIQKQAGVDHADLMIAVTEADETNLLCCMIARHLGCANTIARIRSPEYNEDVYLLKEGLGLSMVVNPERSTAKQISALLQYPSFLKREKFAKGRAEIVEMSVPSGGKLDGMVLSELYKSLRVHVLVCAVERENNVYIPDGRFTLQAGDHIYVTAATSDLLSLLKSTGYETPRVRSVLMIGGSRIAVYLTQFLAQTGVDAKIIETDLDRCNLLSEKLPKAEIIHADGTSFSVLRQEGIEEMDAVIALTNIDEQNIIASMFAHRLEVPKVVCKVNRTEYASIMSDDIRECVITPRILTANDILRYVRAMENRPGEGVITLHRLVSDRVEALEFAVNPSTWYVDTPLKEIPIRGDLRIALITRHGNTIVPSGEDSLKMGDSCVIVTTSAGELDTLNDIFTQAPRGTRA